MREATHRAVAAAGRVVDVVLGGLLLAIVGITLTATSMRYFFGGAIPWNLDVSLLFFVWMVQLGALRTAHIRVDFIVDALPPHLRRATNLATAALSVVALTVLTYGAVKMAAFLSGDRYISLPWLPESARFLPFFLVGPVWILIIVANETRWTDLRRDRRAEGSA